jgi:hypothetical protein
MTYFHMNNATLSSALNRFTSEFGMGSGGSNSLWSPSKIVSIGNIFLINKVKANRISVI